MNRQLLLHGDSYTLINQLLTNGTKVNHIITDPPYNISQANNFSTMLHPRHGVDFGLWDNGVFDLYSWIPLYTRLLTENGSIIIFCSYRFISHIVDVLESVQCKMQVKDIIIWQKTNPMPRNIHRRYVQDMEFAIWAVKKNSKWVFNKPDSEKYLRALYKTPLVSGKERLGHPTQKSLQLMKKIIMVHTNVGETILDPFMGTGTTGDAALSLGRNFIGIEREDNFFEMAQNRLMHYKYENEISTNDECK